MASYWRQGGGVADEAEDDFDEYDPTPYGGGYDLSLTFGRPLAPSEETCYPVNSSSSAGIDYQRPSYSSGSKPSAYAPEYDQEDRYGHAQVRPQAAYGFRPKQEEEVSAEEQGGGGFGHAPSRRPDAYGFRPNQEVSVEEEEGSGFGRAPSRPPQAAYDFRPNQEQEGGFELGGGRRPLPTPAFGVGSKYGSPSDYGSEQGSFSSYGGRPKREEDEGESYGSKYGTGPKREEEEEGGEQEYKYGSRYKGGVEHSYGGSEYQRKEEQGYGGDDNRRTTNYGYGGRPAQGVEEETGRDQKPSYYNPTQAEGYGRPSYGGDSDDEEKKRHHHKHHHRQNYDDE